MSYFISTLSTPYTFNKSESLRELYRLDGICSSRIEYLQSDIINLQTQNDDLRQRMNSLENINHDLHQRMNSLENINHNLHQRMNSLENINHNRSR
jgi:FtsZ-binding cell division protein ZapB